jgi:hypothetical protein
VLSACLFLFQTQTSVPKLSTVAGGVAPGWTISTTLVQQKEGDISYRNKTGSTSVLHKFTKPRGVDILKSRLQEFAAAPDSKEVVKSTWKTGLWEMHLVIRSLGKQAVASFCSETKATSFVGTTYYALPLNKTAIDDIQGFYHTVSNH